MTTTKQSRAEVTAKFQTHPTDVGSTPVQVALLTERIKYISSHLKTNPKDYAGERGLLKLVGQRRRLMGYLKSSNPALYQKMVKQLEVRK